MQISHMPPACTHVHLPSPLCVPASQATAKDAGGAESRCVPISSCWVGRELLVLGGSASSPSTAFLVPGALSGALWSLGI